MLTKEQYARLSDIFHRQHDEQSETETGDIPTASFTAVVGMVEEYMQAQQRPALDGSDDLAIEALRESAEGEKEQAMRWYLKGFEDAETTERQPVTHEQTMKDAETHFHLVWDAKEETADEYLDRLVKEAAPAWKGVDPQQFLNEVRGRYPEIEWKPGPPDKPGRWMVAVDGDYPFIGTRAVFHSHWALNDMGRVYCPTFPEVEAVKFHAAWPKYPDHV